MSDTVIQVERLAKSYILAHQTGPGRAPYERFSDVVLKAARSTVRALGKKVSSPAQEEFWALKDVSFDIKRGEVVGILGRNGAGKSTLLKILSRITEPTSGRIEIEGRVASLLEVGTGFHRELTGRENIFLNGAILGMGRREIKGKFDEIVAFAEIEKFLDTPVRFYSSGMYVRLAFAVAAHLEPDILIIDEVLAVGDAQFQRKCLGKMKDVSTVGGRTVLFVSHNLAAVQTLCGRVVYLKSGRVAATGPTSELIEQYLEDVKTSEPTVGSKRTELGPGLTLTDLVFDPNPIPSGEQVNFRLALESETKIRVREMALLIYSGLGTRVAVLDLKAHCISDLNLSSRTFLIEGSIPSLRLVEGRYSVGLYINTGNIASDFLDLISFEVAIPSTQTYVPYPAVYRGFLDLDFSATLRTDKVAYQKQ